VEATARALDPVRRRLFRLLLSWARRYGPYREEALFALGLGWPMLRALAAELGRRSVERGILASPDDLYYLRTAEIEPATDKPSLAARCPGHRGGETIALGSQGSAVSCARRGSGCAHRRRSRRPVACGMAHSTCPASRPSSAMSATARR